MTTSQNRILLVDDEQAVLDALCRQHRKHYTLVPACGSNAGLQAVEKEGPFAVVVTDYRMPGMNGTQFLAKAREHDPDMIRIMLTGQADLRTAIDAVNRGHIFRFLNFAVDGPGGTAASITNVDGERSQQRPRLQRLEYEVASRTSTNASRLVATMRRTIVPIS